KNAAPWERQALIKARVSAGSSRLADDYDTLTAQIVYERPLPEDLRDEICRLRQRMEKELGQESAQHHNIKTGRGGMVDVEFLAQYLLLSHGRVHHELRCRNTIDTLHALHSKGLLPQADYDSLVNGYKFLRRLENKLRLVHDQSINQLDSDPESLGKLARHLGYTEQAAQPQQALLEEYSSVTQGIRTIFNRYLSHAD
ncbi:MAG: bifunctional [glutamate--ammonia ligase]-adenylyl-L-tyrosine phosphorylase/[glutamate--ammonia-ligase] adenylyltransferase, partial [Desulfuromonadales bacterium]|nr:bifunctional [glutamate--ammonia ligase]-adenylyl-L-tyrosine phosphorylase/[glutamate--ammonia-ligase] adenylyltransferase [Desulfuromonadales bacterium]